MASRLTNNAIKVLRALIIFTSYIYCMRLQKILEGGETPEKPILQVLVSTYTMLCNY